jgi:hypothetical protein
MRAFKILLNKTKVDICEVEEDNFDIEVLRKQLVENNGYDSNIELEEIDLTKNIILVPS